MDRVISLLAALVALVALGGAVVVHTNADAQRQQMAAEMAQLKLQVGLLSPRSAADVTAATQLQPPAPVERDDGTAEALLALQDRIAALETTTRAQADELASARAALAAVPAAPAEPRVALAGPDVQDAVPAAITAAGPTTDCIPLGTRFIGTAGDSFPVCKTKAVVRVASVSDGIATIGGAGEIAAGGAGDLGVPGCTVTVFSADNSGFAEMRVTCQ